MTAHTLTSGEFAYYPSYYQHTIRNESDRPILYLMFKWRSSPLGLTSQLAAGIYRKPDLISDGHDKSFHRELTFEGSTHFLTNLHVHRSYVPPGGGYEPHEDEYDVLIILLNGKLNSMGKTIEAPALLYHPAGTSHGLRSVGEVAAHYIVVEMHGTRKEFGEPRFAQSFHITQWRRAPQNLKRLLRSQLRRSIPSHLRQKIKKVAPWISR